MFINSRKCKLDQALGALAGHSLSTSQDPFQSHCSQLTCGGPWLGVRHQTAWGPSVFVHITWPPGCQNGHSSHSYCLEGEVGELFSLRPEPGKKTSVTSTVHGQSGVSLGRWYWKTSEAWSPPQDALRCRGQEAA